MRVHILATCRRPELLRLTLLVFESLRVGFPTWPVTVWLNRLESGSAARQAVLEACRDAQVDEVRDTNTIHHAWVEHLAGQELENFVICDTDLIFWEAVEGWKFNRALAGRFIPRFFNEYSNCWDQQRLHTCLLFIQPRALADEARAYNGQFPNHVFLPGCNLFYPLRVPLAYGVNIFFDTTSALFHAIGGVPFTEGQNAAFDHLGFGTISDLVLPHLTDGEQLAANRAAVLANVTLAKGAWKAELAYYEKFTAPIVLMPGADARGFGNYRGGGKQGPAFGKYELPAEYVRAAAASKTPTP